MNVGMILLGGGGYPPDIRVDKEIGALRGEGRSIRLLTNHRTDRSLPDAEEGEGLRIVRKRPRKASRLGRYLSYLTLDHPEWHAAIEEFLVDERIEVVHVHDFTYLPTVLGVMDRAGLRLPVVADLHENMPAALRSYRSDKPPLERLAAAVKYGYSRWASAERRCLRRCDRVIIVVPEAGERLKGYGIPEDRITIVSNTESKTTFSFAEESADPSIVDRYQGKFLLSYIGGLGAHRGISTVLRAMRAIGEAIPESFLVIAGAKDGERKALNELAERLGISDRLEVVGWQPFRSVNSYVLASDICLVPHADFEHTQTTVPHKLFQYMICRRPVLVSDVRPLRRLIGDAGCGFVFKAGDPEDFARQVLYIHDNPAIARERAARAQELALTDYSWEKDAERLRGLYRDLSRRLISRQVETEGR